MRERCGGGDCKIVGGEGKGVVSYLSVKVDLILGLLLESEL